MKNVRFLMVLAACLVAATTLVSCLSDDDDNTTNPSKTYRTLTPAERAMYHSAISGHYAGYLRYARTDNTEDSVAVDWVVTADDSTVLVNNFPVKVLAGYISNAEVRALLEQADPVDLKLQYATPLYELPANISSGYYQYGLIPVERKLEFDLNGKTMTFNFADTYTSPYNGYSYQALAVVYQTAFVGYLILRNVQYDNATYIAERLMVLATPNV